MWVFGGERVVECVKLGCLVFGLGGLGGIFEWGGYEEIKRLV